MAQPGNNAWWLQAQKDTLVDQAQPLPGLCGLEANSRLIEFGPNVLHESTGKSLFLQYMNRFKNPLVLVLLSASAVSALTGEVTDFLIIGFIVLLSVTLDFVQEYKANAAADKLRQKVSIRAMVKRDGLQQEIPASDVVPGDIVLLSAGDLIPADGLVVQAQDFFVKQALLTGEPYPVEKHPEILPDTASDIQEATNAVFMGTSVISGKAQMLVVKTGSQAAIGQIAQSISRQSPPTSFEIGTRRFGMLIMGMTVVMVLFVLFVNAWFHKPWLESFLFAVALAVGLTPELLPMVVSVTLAGGALRMARQEMIVKRLTAIQDLGSMDVLCTDKTGTLTEAKIVMERHVDALGQSSQRVLELAYLNSFFESGLKNSMDEAILSHGSIATSSWKKVDEVPFDFERRCVSVLLDNGQDRWLVVKGAAEQIVGLCTHYETDMAKCQLPIDAQALSDIQGQFHALEADGLRVLGIAWRKVPVDHPHAVVSDETDLVLAGFAAFLDPPKASAASAMDLLKKQALRSRS
jgi:Mg2+-importing ATPase